MVFHPVHLKATIDPSSHCYGLLLMVYCPSLLPNITPEEFSLGPSITGLVLRARYSTDIMDPFPPPFVSPALFLELVFCLKQCNLLKQVKPSAFLWLSCVLLNSSIGERTAGFHKIHHWKISCSKDQILHLGLLLPVES